MARKKKSLEKSPFVSHSIEEIAYAEATTYVIQVGVDFFESKGHLTFTLKNAHSIHSKLLSALAGAVKEGTEADRLTALKCISTLKILPLRIH